MAVLTRDAILAAKDWDFEEFDVPKWGGSIRIRALSAGERLQLAKDAGSEHLEGDEAFRFFFKVIALSVVDDAGALMFDPSNDYEALLAKSWDTLQLVANRIMAFNGMTAETTAELEKN